MNFENIILQPLSWSILEFIYDKEPMKASDIAEQMGLLTRQVDAAITKTLVRHGFVIRVAKLTRLMKKEYNLIQATPRGKAYVEWRHSKS